MAQGRDISIYARNQPYHLALAKMNLPSGHRRNLSKETRPTAFTRPSPRPQGDMFWPIRLQRQRLAWRFAQGRQSCNSDSRQHQRQFAGCTLHHHWARCLARLRFIQRLMCPTVREGESAGRSSRRPGGLHGGAARSVFYDANPGLPLVYCPRKKNGRFRDRRSHALH